MTDSVAVLVPYGGQCEHRARALSWVTEQYARMFGWPVHVGRYDEQPWIKARAIERALAETDADVLVIADGDVWCDATDDAVSQVQRGRPWACPYSWLERLDLAATDELEDTGRPGASRDEPRCRGQIGGGIIVLPRATYEQCPLDPRFLGWGHEDSAWSLAIGALFGEPWRGPATALHLWHPHAMRLSRSKGSEANEQLWMRYQEWVSKPSLIRKLVAEHVCV